MTIATGDATFTGDLTIDSEESVTMQSGDVTAANITLESTPEEIGEPNSADLEEVIALPTASVSMVGGSLSAGDVTFNATATTNMDVGEAYTTNGNVKYGRAAVVSNASIEVSGASDINATGSIVLGATNDVTAQITRVPEDDGDMADNDQEDDAAVSLSVISSSADVVISGTATLDAADAIDIDSLDTVVVNTIANGQLGSSNAGATLATAVVLGDTTVDVQDTPTLTAGSDLTIDASNNRTIDTQSIATDDGAAEDGDPMANNEAQQALEDNDAETADGELSLAAAVLSRP